MNFVKRRKVCILKNINDYSFLEIHLVCTTVMCFIKRTFGEAEVTVLNLYNITVDNVKSLVEDRTKEQ